jgi:hypothetical protein
MVEVQSGIAVDSDRRSHHERRRRCGVGGNPAERLAPKAGIGGRYPANNSQGSLTQFLGLSNCASALAGNPDAESPEAGK